MNSRESRYTKQQRRIEELEAEVRQLRVSEAAALAMLQAERQQAASNQGQLEVGVRLEFRPRPPSSPPACFPCATAWCCCAHAEGSTLLLYLSADLALCAVCVSGGAEGVTHHTARRPHPAPRPPCSTKGAERELGPGDGTGSGEGGPEGGRGAPVLWCRH